MNQFRDRILEVKKIKSAELLDNAGNWRVHPNAQRETMTGVLREIGKADVLLTYYSQRAGGKLVLFDGHLRKALDPDEVWTVAITDLDDAEADKMLLVLDPLAAMAEMNGARVLELTDRVNTDDLMVRELLRKMELEAQRAGEEDDDEEKSKKEKTGPAAMELMPFEHYDYVLLMFKNELDWLAAVDTLGLERRADLRKTNKIGLCRVVSGKQIIERIQQLEFEVANKEKRNENSVPISDVLSPLVSASALSGRGAAHSVLVSDSTTEDEDSHPQPQTRGHAHEPNAETVSERHRDGGRTRSGRLLESASLPRRSRKSRAASAV